MTNTLKLMCVLAHPDDESLGTGGILAQYAAEGIPCGKGDDESWTKETHCDIGSRRLK